MSTSFPPRAGAEPPSAGPISADDAAALLESWSAQGRDQLARAQSLGAALAELSVSVWSPARDVRVTVDHAGLLADLELTDKALDASPLSLGRTITATLRTALRRLEEQAVATAVEHVGAGDGLTASVTATYRLVPPEEDEPSPYGAPRPY